MRADESAGPANENVSCHFPPLLRYIPEREFSAEIALISVRERQRPPAHPLPVLGYTSPLACGWRTANGRRNSRARCIGSVCGIQYSRALWKELQNRKSGRAA